MMPLLFELLFILANNTAQFGSNKIQESRRPLTILRSSATKPDFSHLLAAFDKTNLHDNIGQWFPANQISESYPIFVGYFRPQRVEIGDGVKMSRY